MFEAGEFVQCIDDRARDGVKLLKRGAIYTVAHSRGTLLLIEEHDPPTPFIAFRASRFRRLPKRQTETVRQLMASADASANHSEPAR